MATTKKATASPRRQRLISANNDAASTPAGLARAKRAAWSQQYQDSHSLTPAQYHAKYPSVENRASQSDRRVNIALSANRRAARAADPRTSGENVVSGQMSKREARYPTATRHTMPFVHDKKPTMKGTTRKVTPVRRGAKAD